MGLGRGSRLGGDFVDLDRCMDGWLHVWMRVTIGYAKSFVSIDRSILKSEERNQGSETSTCVVEDGSS